MLKKKIDTRVAAQLSFENDLYQRRPGKPPVSFRMETEQIVINTSRGSASSPLVYVLCIEVGGYGNMAPTIVIQQAYSPGPYQPPGQYNQQGPPPQYGVPQYGAPSYQAQGAYPAISSPPAAPLPPANYASSVPLMPAGNSSDS